MERSFKPLEELTLMDDYMFTAVMSDEENLKPLLERILKIEIDGIEFVEPQATRKEGYASRGVRLDLYVRDTCGQIFNVEVQTTSKKNLPKRMRYYQSVIDVDVLAPGVDYGDLNKSFVVFICDYDPFGGNRCVYTFENRCVEGLGLAFGDETRKVVVNAKGPAGDVGDALGEVLVYLRDGRPTGHYTRQLDEAVALVKSSEERRHEYMVRMIREMEIREEARAEGFEQGFKEGFKQGFKQGFEQGLEQGRILGTLETLREDGRDDRSIVERLMRMYGLSRAEAEGYVLPS